MYNYTTISCMEQLNLFEKYNRHQNKSHKKLYKYTLGVINDYETLWFVNNNHKEKNKVIMEYLLMYPHTRPLQSNYKFYQYQLLDNQKNK